MGNFCSSAEGCKTMFNLIEESDCQGAEAGTGGEPMTQQRCLDAFGSSGDNTLMLTSSCSTASSIQGYARDMGIQPCHANAGVRVNTRTGDSENHSHYESNDYEQCIYLSSDREPGMDFPGRCSTFYEILGHPSGVGKKCRACAVGDNCAGGRVCVAGDFCYT